MSQIPPSFAAAADTREAKNCLAAIAALPLYNAERTHNSIVKLLSAMRRSPPQAAGYLEVLESLEQPLAFAQGELASRYAEKPLPPNQTENEAFERVVAAWQQMAQGYAQIAQLGHTSPSIENSLALICQRCLYYTGQVILEHFRARRALAPGLWLDLHGYYATAEEWGLTGLAVWEAKDVSTTCGDTFAALLLADLADPYGCNPRELSAILDWAQRFAPLTTIRTSRLAADACAYGIDLMQDRGLCLAEALTPGEPLRYLDTARLAPCLRQLIAQLKRGVPAATLGLGGQCQQPAAARLLSKISRAWCKTAVVRRYERSKVGIGNLSVCSGLDAIHYYVSGTEFKQPDHVRIFSRKEMDQLATFRFQVDPVQPLHARAAQMGYMLEQWRITDQSLNGFSILREAAGGRIGHDELLAIKFKQVGHFLLAQVRWLRLEFDGCVHAGIQVMPGRPQAIHVRAYGAGVLPSRNTCVASCCPRFRRSGSKRRYCSRVAGFSLSAWSKCTPTGRCRFASCGFWPKGRISNRSPSPPPEGCEHSAAQTVGRQRRGGKRMLKQLPRPGWLSISSVAWCLVRTCLTIARPSPVPPDSRERPR